jgi:hypothetical protein
MIAEQMQMKGQECRRQEAELNEKQREKQATQKKEPGATGFEKRRRYLQTPVSGCLHRQTQSNRIFLRYR